MQTGHVDIDFDPLLTIINHYYCATPIHPCHATGAGSNGRINFSGRGAKRQVFAGMPTKSTGDSHVIYSLLWGDLRLKHQYIESRAIYIYIYIYDIYVYMYILHC